MSTEKLKKNLLELQIELEKLHFDNEAHRDRVSQAVADLEQNLLDESFMSGDEYLLHELTEAIDAFEQAHPRLTEIVGRMSDILAKMGI